MTTEEDYPSITRKETPNTPADLINILHPLVKRWFFSRFKEFSLPQLFGVMEIHSRKNVLVSAPTGATKTLTGFLSILNELIDSHEKGILEDHVYCVYVSPLRALSNDIEKNLKEPLKEMEELAGKPLPIRIGVRTGDTTTAEKSRMLKHPPHILITTPESLAIMLTSPKFSGHLREVEWMIIDEIHALAENKRGTHMAITLERLQRLSGYVCRIGLSATVAPLGKIARFLVGSEADTTPRPCTIIDVQFIKDMDLKVLCPVADIINTTFEESNEAMYTLIDKLVQGHRTTLIFTNTRAATERVVDTLKERFPTHYTENIGAHHGSLSKELRFSIEERLRKGQLKCIVSSTSLELGIDIGYIDLVICLGSPKSIARFLQRAGRAGHQLHETVKARIIVSDRDDLVECACLLKSAIERKIDRVSIPTNALDVLAQQIYGIAIFERMHIEDLYAMIRQSYPYNTLDHHAFRQIIDYLAGRFSSLESRHIYAKIWHDEETGMIGRRGKLARVIYMTNIGTIPDETKVMVKIGEHMIGTIDEGFLERLHRGDVFVLGGATYEFRFSRGMVAQVVSSVGRPPTIPSWFSEMLPLTYDLALSIGRFRRLIHEQFARGESEEEIKSFIDEFLYVDTNGRDAIYQYFEQQFTYIKIPHDKRIIMEHYREEKRHYAVFHTLFGRRVNDCLSRAVAYVVARVEHRDLEIGITDNGFFLASDRPFRANEAFKILKAEKLDLVMDMALEHTEILKRRFRHCATRSLMILRNYRGRQKRVGRQQVSSQILINALRRIDRNFSIIREAKREVLEDLMDISHTKEVLSNIESGRIKVVQIETSIPSPFSFNLILQAHTDMLRIEDKAEFLRRMHQMVLAKISLKKGKALKG
ncbi:MAG: ATP-dependent helicase [archaeon]